jgi:hypothetical protein
MSGYMTFRLEFHLAHLILRESKPDAGTHRTSVGNVSFLTSGASSTISPPYEMHQAHISIVVCGWSNKQWTGYAFANTGLDADSTLDYDEDGPRLDFFAADRDDDHIKDADMPTWDARKYWLQVVAVRCRLVLKEWVYLVRNIEDCVRVLVTRAFLSGRSN